MTDLISRADAIEAFDRGRVYHKSGIEEIINALPSAELPNGDLISRQWLLEVYGDYIGDNGEPKYYVPLEVVRQNIKDAPSAEAVPTVIRAKTFMRKEDFDKWTEDIKKQNKSIVCIPCDAEVVSADAVHGEWIDIDNYYRLATCSHCRKVTMFEKWGEYTKPYNFCPNCGAKMYKGGDDE